MRATVAGLCDGLCDRMVVFNGPLRVASGTSNGGVAKSGVAHGQHPKLGRHAVQVQADSVEVGISGASRQRRGHGVLSGSIFRHGLGVRV